MKLLLFTILMMLSFSTSAVEFYQCIDDKGHPHFTNLPKSSLDSNCSLKTDHFSLMLNQDYLNLANEFKKYEVNKEEELDEIMLSLDSITQPVMDILDPDKALDELVDASLNKRENAATKLFKARSKAVEQILNEANPNSPPDNE